MSAATDISALRARRQLQEAARRYADLFERVTEDGADDDVLLRHLAIAERNLDTAAELYAAKVSP